MDTTSRHEGDGGVQAPPRRRWLRRVRGATVAGGVIAVAGVAAVGLWVASLGAPPLGRDLDVSTVVLDRGGRLLRPYTTRDGRWRLRAALADVDPRYLALLVAYEDKRFYSHHGVDPAAMLRSAVQLATHGRIVSGGSTLTMQVARLLEPRAERSFAAKLRQMVRAIEIERTLSKPEVLGLYLTLAPYGGNLEGVRAAALTYFGREPRRLSLGEAALLVALPQSPEARRPDRFAATAQRARDRVLDRAAALAGAPLPDIERARNETTPQARHAMPLLAPHAGDALVARDPGSRRHDTTIDGAWQAGLQDLARDRSKALGPDVSIAILAMDNATGEVLAHVGGADYFDARRAGQVDMTQAVRSPGSTLKPFIYGLGFEDGMIHPETLIEDRPTRYGAYAPENFDLTYQGVVSVRKALQLSLNVPAVAVLDKVGASRFTARLAQAGGALVLPKGEVPGLAMGLGGVGVTLADLVKLYGGIARLGDVTPPIMTAARDASGPPETRRLMEPLAAWYVANVLLGTPPPDNAPAGRIAFKTGTSYGYRDAWAVGFDGRRTIGVWVGRPDGAPVPGITGRSAAAPVLFDAFARQSKPLAPLPHAPKGAIFAANPKLPLPLQRFRDQLPTAATEPPVKITFPPNGASLDLAAADRDGVGAIAMKVAGGKLPLTVLVNGAPVERGPDKRRLFFTPPGLGFVRLTVMDALGKADSVMVRMQ